MGLVWHRSKVNFILCVYFIFGVIVWFVELKWSASRVSQSILLLFFPIPSPLPTLYFVTLTSR